MIHHVVVSLLLSLRSHKLLRARGLEHCSALIDYTTDVLGSEILNLSID